MSDLISRQAAITIPVMPKEHRHYQTNNLDDAYDQGWFDLQNCIEQLPSAEPEIVRCKDCKHNPKESWFECPMSHLSEKQRPETAWCWKGERKDDE